MQWAACRSQVGILLARSERMVEGAASKSSHHDLYSRVSRTAVMIAEENENDCQASRDTQMVTRSVWWL